MPPALACGTRRDDRRRCDILEAPFSLHLTADRRAGRSLPLQRPARQADGLLPTFPLVAALQPIPVVAGDARAVERLSILAQ